MRVIAVAVCLAALIAAARSGHAQPTAEQIRTAIGPMRLVSPQFGYAVAYRTVAHGDTADTTARLFVYDHGRWSDVTPRALPAPGIDDVAFIDRRHAWVAPYD